MSRPQHILCGMYAFTTDLQNAWSDVFKNVHPYLGLKTTLSNKIIWGDEDQNFLSSNLLVGHTCGYPYIEKWHQSHRLVCVAEFDIEGCIGSKYSSWFIASSKDSRNKISEFSNSTIAMNNPDSNSGMNVLRYVVSALNPGKSFFEKVITSNSHITSMQMITDGTVELAAIDCVSYYQAIAQGIVDPDLIKVIGQSVFTAGLPFIAHNSLAIENRAIIDAMNQSLQSASPSSKQILKIKQFLQVEDGDYDFTRKIKQKAIDYGYPNLK